MTDSANVACAPESKGERRNGISFSALREGRCKFPLGNIDDPPERFCGATTPVGSPYCEHCRQLAFVPTARRLRLNWR
jgi:hypothetical protein